jgi:hypothetical protein
MTAIGSKGSACLAAGGTLYPLPRNAHTHET